MLRKLVTVKQHVSPFTRITYGVVYDQLSLIIVSAVCCSWLVSIIIRKGDSYSNSDYSHQDNNGDVISTSHYESSSGLSDGWSIKRPMI